MGEVSEGGGINKAWLRLEVIHEGDILDDGWLGLRGWKLLKR